MFVVCTNITIKIITCDYGIMVMNPIIIGAVVATLFFIGTVSTSFAHTTVEVQQYRIEAGWAIEPPIVGIRNDLVFKVTEPGVTENTYQGTTQAFQNLEVVAMYGGATKKIDINSDPRPGYYFSPIIPTKTGTYLVELSGSIEDVLVDVQIPIEDVESTSILDFPVTGDSSQTDISAIKNAISSLQQDISELESGETSTVSATNGSDNDGTAYNFAVFALSIAGAAIILAIIALLKRK